MGLVFSPRKIIFDIKKQNTSKKNLDKILTCQPTPARQPQVATEPTKATKAKTKRKIFSLKLSEELLIEIINKEKKHK